MALRLLLCLFLFWPAMSVAEDRPVLVFAASSQREALAAIAKAYTAHTGRPVLISAAGTAVLARQIEAGAPVDIFVSADTIWMNRIETLGLIESGSRWDIAGNRLVLIAPAGREPATGLAALAALPKGERIAVADPETVPAGRYAKTALRKLGYWKDLQHRLTGSDNVRIAMALVARGEVPLGIVYASDARLESRVKVIARVPADHHLPIVYPAALIRGANPDAAALLGFMRSPTARLIFAKFGFTVP